MPEYPEIFVFARDMRKELVGKTIHGIDVLQQVPEHGGGGFSGKATSVKILARPLSVCNSSNGLWT